MLISCADLNAGLHGMQFGVNWDWNPEIYELQWMSEGKFRHRTLEDKFRLLATFIFYLHKPANRRRKLPY
jgi:hypothetical protein